MENRPQIGKYFALETRAGQKEKGYVILSTRGNFFIADQDNILQKLSAELEELAASSFKERFFISSQGTVFPADNYDYGFIEHGHLVWRPESNDYVQISPVSKDLRTVFDRTFEFHIFKKYARSGAFQK